jgi:CheY-specific phosphatase CheX
MRKRVDVSLIGDFKELACPMDGTRPGEVLGAEADAVRLKLRALVRHASLSRLSIHTDCPLIETREMDAGFRPGRMLATHMVLILVSGDALRLTFKVHFNLRTAKNLAWRIYGGTSSENISAQQAIDYFKEYGNLVAGSVISLLGESHVALGISLPLCTRGFYEVFADYADKPPPRLSFADFWELQAAGGGVYCSAQFEIIDPAGLQPLIDYVIDETPADDDGEMDFL